MSREKGLICGCKRINTTMQEQMNQELLGQKLDTLIEKVDELRNDTKAIANNVNQNAVDIAKTSTDMG